MTCPSPAPATAARSSVVRRLVALSLIAPISATAQAGRLVEGTAIHATSGAPVEGVAVRLAGEPAVAARTRSAGAFRLRVADGAVTLLATRIGFAAETLVVPAAERRATLRLRPVPPRLDRVVVAGDRGASAAASDVIRDFDIQLRPRDSSQELLRLVPGLVIAQHGGGGKAEQIFLRGFDADHGTDVAVSVDGTPVNLVSHGHGQGYADLHFLIPETVERIEVRKGPYDVRDGDFATAGAVGFRTRDRLGETRVSARAGSFGTGRALLLAPFGGDASRAGGYAAISTGGARGPFEQPQGHRRTNAFVKLTAPVGAGAELYATASGFAARWNQSGQVPARAVASGRIGRFGSLDPTEGGATGRFDVSLGVRSRAAGDGDWDLRVYASRYRFQLFSNFTFFLADSVDGDGIEQTDARALGGAVASYRRRTRLFGAAGEWLAGAGVRADRAHVTLSTQRARVRLDARADARIAQANLFSYAQREVSLGSRTTVQAGLRGDVFRFGVADRLASGAPGAPGAGWRGVVSPKLGVTRAVGDAVTLYGNAGLGFHSNDARDVLSGEHTGRMLPRATGAEAGTRYAFPGGTAAATAWLLDLQSELVYVGDEGVTEPNGATRRVGLDVEARVQPRPWLVLDADVSLARGRFRDLPAGADRIALAPTVTSAGGVTLGGTGAGAGGLRYRHVGARAANEDASVMAGGHALWELFGSYRFRRVVARVAVDNLFDAAWAEAQFATTSRLRLERAPVTELHFTPGAPRGVTVGLEYAF